MSPAEPEGSTGRLAGRRVLITGGASGIGAQTAALFVKEGARVVIADRDAAKLAEVAAETGAHPVAFDVTDAEAVRAGVREAARLLGGIDGLVNAAGISISEPFAETTLDIWQRALDVNLTGVYLVCHAALPYLQRTITPTIVNLASALAHQPLRNRAAYAASKAGVVAFSKVLALELAPRIRCNVISPGAIETPMVTDMFTDPADMERIRNLYALRRIGRPEEVAEAILFLTSAESAFVTGSTLAIDGGRIFH